MADRDLYSILGVAKDAKTDQIKKAYRKLAREHHPDRNPDNPASADRFKDVSRAYEVLSAPKKRKLYDEFGEVGLKDGFDAEAYRQYQAWQRAGGGRGRGPVAGPDEIFAQGGGRGGSFSFNLEDLLGGRLDDLLGNLGASRGARPRSRKGPDLESELRISFAEAVRGVEKGLTLAEPGERGKPRTIKVRIPAGVEDGDRVRLRGQGGRTPAGGEPGDLVLRVRVAEHPHFWRMGADLHLDLPVTPVEAYEGRKVLVPTIDGEVSLTIPAGAQGGTKLRLRGKGVPRREGGRGDLIVHVEIHLPPGRSKKTSELLEALETEYEANPRADLTL